MADLYKSSAFSTSTSDSDLIRVADSDRCCDLASFLHKLLHTSPSSLPSRMSYFKHAHSFSSESPPILPLISQTDAIRTAGAVHPENNSCFRSDSSSFRGLEAKFRSRITFHSGNFESDADNELAVGASNLLSNNVNRTRSSSKRSRAAEVHNLSEKRRRSRINEKMKALQMLIPNSNKTDKASMLDEAIEYLKQLQLQVQMLSIRNRSGLQPQLLSEDLQKMHLPQAAFEFHDSRLSESNQLRAMDPAVMNAMTHCISSDQQDELHTDLDAVLGEASISGGYGTLKRRIAEKIM